MKAQKFLAGLFLLFAAELTALLFFSSQDAVHRPDVIRINEAFQSLQDGWDAIENHTDQTGLDYVALDLNGNVRFRTGPGLSESIHAAVTHRDTILDLEIDGLNVGKVIFYNDSEQIFRSQKYAVIGFVATAMLLQTLLCAGYFLYLNHAVGKPFRRLKRFAERVADGNLDIPLEMDRENFFGSFTESFDLMRSELKKARLAEAEANARKKELVARLSHDIKTPLASIKAASEVGAALAGDDKLRENYDRIIQKSDQINTLVTNLFSASLKELEQLPVIPEDMPSRELKTLLENSDYLRRTRIPEIPDCLLRADRLRLQQVFDNIFANSYKYAGTSVFTSVSLRNCRLIVCMEDSGDGVPAEELPFLKEKFRRGKNAGRIEGAGLGLYISDYFMKGMDGELLLENGETGLKVSVKIPLSGTV
ncbi:MAG: HAMP domain-containing histidine kinase [Lachnospiraceae bacterium]|nr:HAMP domain-containing histidine kinase [Lachnospiraceae bacterium]